MPIKDVGFRIRIPVAPETQATQKALEKQKKTVAENEKQVTKLGKAFKTGLKDAKRATEEADESAKKLGRTFSSSLGDGLRSVNRFSEGVDKLRSKVLNLKTAIAGTTVGIAAIWAGKKLYEAGKANLAVEGRIQREFGGEADILKRIAGNAGFRAGVSEDETIKGLIPLRERLDDIEAGAQFRGMRRKLTAAQAQSLRERNLTFGANLFARVNALAPDLDKDQVGAVLADALSGPEGIKRLISEFNLSKKSKTIAAANDKGDVYKFLREEERKKYNVMKKGQFLEQGDLVDILLSRSGITEEAADAKRRKLGFQLKQIGAEFENTFADIGARALDRFNGGMGKGTSLAEKFQAAIKSREGQKVIQELSDGVVALADGAVTVAKELPKIAGFLNEHKTTLITLAGAFGGIKIMSKLGGTLNAFKGGSDSPGGLGASLIGKLAGGAYKGAMPVYVVNNDKEYSALAGQAGKGIGGKLGKLAGVAGGAASVFSALTGGYAVGTVLDDTFGISDKIGNLANRDNAKDAAAKNEASIAKVLLGKVNAGKETGAQAAAELERFARSAEGKDADHLSPEVKALINALKSVPAQPTIVNMDGQKVAEIVEKHIARGMANKTARGAAPTYAGE
jgi:hypothetical protein